MVWGCFSFFEFLPLFPIQGNMYQIKYRILLQGIMLPQALPVPCSFFGVSDILIMIPN